MILLLVILFLTLLFITFYFYTTRNHKYWLQRKVKHENPIPLFGNHFNAVFGIQTLTEIAVELYNKYPNEKVVGYFRGNIPELIIRDPEIIRDILSVDFTHFHSRFGFGRNIEKEPLLKNIFSANGDAWKLLRKELSPAFTSSKIKSLFPLIISCAEKLQLLGQKIIDSGGDFNAHDMTTRFTIEFIGAYVFGIEMGTISSEKSTFQVLGNKLFEPSLRERILINLYDLIPELVNNIPVLDKRLDKFLTDVVKSILEERNYKANKRNDFMDLLIELLNKGKLEGQSLEHKNIDNSSKIVELEFDLKCLVAQVFMFFGAGFETSSSTSSYLMHELAFNPDKQVKIQEEIDRILTKYDNKLCYEAISEMVYLDMALKESLRLFPPLGLINRECSKPYTISKLNITIDPGVKIILPAQALQKDELYYDNPEEFRPERFASDMHNLRNKYVFLAFGEGPRICLGARLGQLQSMVGVAAVFQKFSVEPSAKSRRKLKMVAVHDVIQTIKGGIPLKLKLRTK